MRVTYPSFVIFIITLFSIFLMPVVLADEGLNTPQNIKDAIIEAKMLPQTPIQLSYVATLESLLNDAELNGGVIQGHPFQGSDGLWHKASVGEIRVTLGLSVKLEDNVVPKISGSGISITDIASFFSILGVLKYLKYLVEIVKRLIWWMHFRKKPSYIQHWPSSIIRFGI